MDDVTIEQMAEMLSDDKPAAEPATSAAEPVGEAKPAAGSPEAKPAETPASPDKGENDASDSGADTNDIKPPVEGKEQQKPKFEPKKEAVPESVQKRINKAIWEKHEAQREADQAKREAEELRKKLETQAPGKPAGGNAPSDKPAPTSGFAEPEPSEDDFETLTDHVKAVAAWQYRKEHFDQQARAAAEQSARAQTEASAKWQARVAEYAVNKPQINEAISVLGKFLTQAGQADFIMESSVGLEIVEHLYGNAESTVKLAESGDPLVIAREIGRIEAQLLKQQGRPKPNPEPSPDDQLPDPVAVVGGRASASSGVDLSDEKTSMADWSREFKRQIEAAS